MPVISYIDAITMALKEEMERDDKVFILGEDVGKKGGVFKATAGLYDCRSRNWSGDVWLSSSCRNAICGLYYACCQPNYFRSFQNSLPF
ncbi:2-oxoisovalerate dehydrogenase subunit beta [Listeria monocytogenes N53-1]|nr:2-oxoisovalerate dehydrogenase subunit beta [Listeria monocytogenes]CCQ23929.1 2-oxoisovalerate dehydrogenase subunit beta [Listeria monocytogenes N53-1]